MRSWFDESVFAGYVQRDTELRERLVRVEEEIKIQSYLIRIGVERVDSRFEDVNNRFAEQRNDFLAQFERIDGKYAEQRDDFLARFERIDGKFAEQRDESNRRFDVQREDFNVRFTEQREDINLRFAEQREDINLRFAEQRDEFNARFDETNRNTNRWMTVLTIMLALTGIAVTVTNLIP